MNHCPCCGQAVNGNDFLFGVHEVFWKGRRLSITPGMVSILRHLTQAKGGYIGRPRGMTYKTYQVYIFGLRKEFYYLDIPFKIETLYGEGKYRMCPIEVKNDNRAAKREETVRP